MKGLYRGFHPPTSSTALAYSLSSRRPARKERAQILDAIFDLSHEEVVKHVQAGILGKITLSAHDYVHERRAVKVLTTGSRHDVHVTAGRPYVLASTCTASSPIDNREACRP